MSPVRIATRPSKLAMRQATMVAALLEERKINVSLLQVSSSGDRNQNLPLFKMEGTGIFVEEVNSKILRDEADLAVHSAKDLPSVLPEELEIMAVLPRENPVDVLISNYDLMGLPKGATIGTSSIRRSHQLNFVRGDLKVVNLRGNLDTRIDKFHRGLYDGIIVAKAGLTRLELDVPYFELDRKDFLPAPNQGIIAIVGRKDSSLKEEISRISDKRTFEELRVERRLISKLHLGCSLPAAILCERTRDNYRISCRFYSKNAREFKEFLRVFTDPGDVDKLASEIIERVPESYGYQFGK